MTIDAILTIGTTTYDVSDRVVDVRQNSLEVRQSVGDDRYRFARDSARLVLRYDPALALLLLQATDRVKIAVDLDNTPVFRGEVRPASSLTVSTTPDVITLECLDNSFLLDRPLSTRKLLTNKAIYDGATHIVGDLIAGLGVAVSTTAPTIATVIPEIVFDEGENVLKALSDLLYGQGYTLAWTEAGELIWREWILSSYTPGYTFSDGPSGQIVGDAELTKSELSKKDGVELTYSVMRTVTGTIVYSEAYDNKWANNGDDLINGTLYFSWPYSSFRVHQLINPRIRFEVQSFNWIGPVRVGKSTTDTSTLPLVAGARGGGVRVASVSLSASSCTIKLEADDAGWAGVFLKNLRIITDAKIEEEGLKVFSQNTPNSNPEKVSVKYLYSPNRAQDWANAFYQNVISNPYTIKIASYENRPVGEVVTINTTVGGFTFDGVIFKKTFSRLERIYRYEIRAISTITPASSTSSTPESPFVPDGNDITEIIIGDNLETPDVELRPQAPAVLRRGLRVYAAGELQLEIAQAVRGTLEQEASVSIGGSSSLYQATWAAGQVFFANVVGHRIGANFVIDHYNQADFGFGMEAAFFYGCDFFDGEVFWLALRASTGEGFVLDKNRQKIGNAFAVFSLISFPGYSLSVIGAGHFLVCIDGHRYETNDNGATWTDTNVSESVVGVRLGASLWEVRSSGIWRDGSQEEVTSLGTVLTVQKISAEKALVSTTTHEVVLTATNYEIVSHGKRTTTDGSGLWFWIDGTTIKKAEGSLSTPASTVWSIPIGLLDFLIYFSGKLFVKIGSNFVRLSVYQLITSSPAFMPTGSILPFASATPPKGWLVCDGAEVSRTAYASLFAVIGTTWGSGDGVTTFNLPDLREVALVGSGTSARPELAQNHDTYTVGQYKNDQLQEHAHPKGNDSNGENYQSGTGNQTGGGGYWNRKTGGVVSISGNTPRVGTVTRGKRVGVLYIIKT